MTVFLGIQPVVLDGLMGNDAFRGRGLTARFLYSIPTSTVGGRKYETRSIPDDVKGRYSQMIQELLSITQPDIEHVLDLTPEAYELSKTFFYELEPRLRGDLESMGDWAGKLHGAILRIAGVLHAIQNRERSATVQISGATMVSAVRIGYYFLDHAKAVYRLMGADKQTADARYIIRKLEQGQFVEITRTELNKLCHGRFAKADEMNPALDLLVENGYIRKEYSEVKDNNRRQLFYKINPEAYGISGISGICYTDGGTNPTNTTNPAGEEFEF